MAWTVELDAEAADEFKGLTRAIQLRIASFIRERLEGAEDPTVRGTRLKGAFAGLWRFRVGDYRLIARLDTALSVVVILQIGHRREIYRG